MSDLLTLTLLKDLQDQVKRTLKEIGPEGPVGPAGPTGAQGPQGNEGRPGPSGERGPEGPAGADGSAGEAGEDGRGVESVTQAADGDLIFTLTDGTEEIIELPLGLLRDSQKEHILYKQGYAGGSGDGSIGPVTTSMVATEPDVMFRDAKGRFKSVDVPDLKNQLEVNRWLLEQIEGIEAGEGPAGPPGKDGEDGAPGRDGVDGKDGDPGKDGASIKGDKGEDGADGKDGVNGKDGANGKDGTDGDSFFQDIGSNTIEYFGDQLWITSLRDPFFIGAKIGTDSSFTGTVTANKFVGDGSGIVVAGDSLLANYEAQSKRMASMELEVASLEAGLFKSSEYRYVDYKVTGMHRDFIPNQGQFQLLDKDLEPIESFNDTKFIVLGHPKDSNWALSTIDLSPFSALRIVGLDGSLILTATITDYIMNEQNLPELALKVSHSLDIPAPNADKFSLSVENAIRFDG